MQKLCRYRQGYHIAFICFSPTPLKSKTVCCKLTDLAYYFSSEPIFKPFYVGVFSDLLLPQDGQDSSQNVLLTSKKGKRQPTFSKVKRLHVPLCDSPWEEGILTCSHFGSWLIEPLLLAGELVIGSYYITSVCCHQIPFDLVERCQPVELSSLL